MVENKDIYNYIHLINDGLEQNNKDEGKLHVKLVFKIRSKDTNIEVRLIYFQSECEQ
jgi:predicted NUDIX family phosphoesterase